MAEPRQAEPTLLVYIEDSVDNLRLMEWVLEADGRYRVLGAADGIAGLELIREKRPALVLLDLEVPLLDGFEVAKRVRADPALRSIPLVAVSACVMRDERRRSLQVGCMAFVEKPYDVLALRKLVDKIVTAQPG
jgi:two-component system, cell cycle response regulator DivK